MGSTYNKINNLYNIDYNIIDSLNYGSYRQHNFNSLMSVTNPFGNYIDINSLEKFCNYNLGVNTTKNIINKNTENINDNFSSNEIKINEIFFRIYKNINKNNYLFFSNIQYPSFHIDLNYENDSKQYNNVYKYNLLEKKKNKNYLYNQSFLNNIEE